MSYQTFHIQVTFKHDYVSVCRTHLHTPDDIFRYFIDIVRFYWYFPIFCVPPASLLYICLPPSSSLTFVILTWLITSSWIVTYCPTRNLELSGIYIGVHFLYNSQCFQIKINIQMYTPLQMKWKKVRNDFFTWTNWKNWKNISIATIVRNYEKWNSARQSNHWHLPICNRVEIQFNLSILFQLYQSFFEHIRMIPMKIRSSQQSEWL